MTGIGFLRLSGVESAEEGWVQRGFVGFRREDSQSSQGFHFQLLDTRHEE